MRLQDKVAIVTGGGQGIGKATSIKFAQEGAKVVVADMNEETANAVVNEITSAGGQAVAAVANVSQEDSAQALIDKAVEWGGSVDILVNNAGITKDTQLRKMTKDEWDAVINVNLTGVWLCGRAAAVKMLDQGSGVILNGSSISGLTGNFGQSNYTATKGALIAMTKTWALELGAKNVRVNAIAPGFTATPMVETVPEKVIEKVKGKTPLGRLGLPEDIANVYTFLASDDASFITGQVIVVDGGLTLGTL
jgi:3-oxoacyl-[acyl-carrier protein] reductase